MAECDVQRFCPWCAETVTGYGGDRTKLDSAKEMARHISDDCGPDRTTVTAQQYVERHASPLMSAQEVEMYAKVVEGWRDRSLNRG